MVRLGRLYSGKLADIAALTPTDSNFIVGNGSEWVAESGATARASLGLTIGTDVQAYDAGLLSLAGLEPLSAERLEDPGFDDDTEWTGTDWDVNNRVASHASKLAGTGTDTLIERGTGPFTVVSGVTYKIVVDIAGSGPATGVKIDIGGDSSGTFETTEGVHTYYLDTVNTDSLAILGSCGAVDFLALASISVKEVLTNTYIKCTDIDTYALRTPSEAREDLGLVIGVDVLPFDETLKDLAGLGIVEDNEFIVGTGTGVFAYESGATARTSLGLGTIATFAGDQNLQTTDTPTFASGIFTTSAIQSPGLIGYEDPDTFLSFGGDKITFQAGGVNFFQLAELKQNAITFNIDGEDVDCRFRSENNNEFIYLDAHNDIIYYGDGGITHYTSLGTTGNIVQAGSATASLGATDISGTLAITDNLIHTGNEWTRMVFGEGVIFFYCDQVPTSGAIKMLSLHNSLVLSPPYFFTINPDGNDVDTYIEGLNNIRLVYVDASTDTVHLGNATNEAVFSTNGELSFIGTAGMVFGSFWGNEIGFVVAGGTGTYQDIFDGDITTGQLHNVTHNTTDENTLDIGTFAGMYLVNWSMSVKATGANKHIIGAIGIDAGGGADSLTAQNDGRNHVVSTGNVEFGLSGTAILDLSANSEVGLMVTNETDGTNITVEHVSLSILQVGGT